MASSEFFRKHQLLKTFLKQHSLQGVLLSSRENFSWLSCGRTNHVRTDSEKGVASLWVTAEGVELWCNSIEEVRFRMEETKGLPFQYRIHPWHQGFNPTFSKAGSDDGAFGLPVFKEEIARLRWSSTKEEMERFRKVGRLSGSAMDEAGKKVRKGWSEFQLAAELSRELVLRGLEASVVLVGADERLTRDRHPIPTSHKIKKTAM